MIHVLNQISMIPGVLWYAIRSLYVEFSFHASFESKHRKLFLSGQPRYKSRQKGLSHRDSDLHQNRKSFLLVTHSCPS